MRSIKKTAALSMVVLVLAAGTVSAKTVPGTNAGEVLRGTNHADTIYGKGGADLVYGRGGGDTVWGGNEAGWGDKVLGGAASDRLIGQRGHDALYGEGGNDRLERQHGDNLLIGGPGEDKMFGGPGADKVDARYGRRDVIDLTGLASDDVVYYDKGIDKLVVSAETAGTSAAEAARSTGVELSPQEPPAGLFEHHGKVLVAHEGEGLLVPEKELGAHLGHGDEILDPTGRAGEEKR